MLTGAMVLGIIGGVVGLFLGILGLFGATVLGDLGMEEDIWLAALLLVLALAGVVGGGIVKAKPGLSSVLMLVGGIGGFLIVWSGWFYWAFPGILLLIAGGLALAGRKQGARG